MKKLNKILHYWADWAGAAGTAFLMALFIAASPSVSGARPVVNVQEKVFNAFLSSATTVNDETAVNVTASSVTLANYQMVQIQNLDATNAIYCGSDSDTTVNSGTRLSSDGGQWYIAISSPVEVWCISDGSGSDVRIASWR